MKRVLSIIAGVLVLALAAVAVFLFTPVSDPDLSSHPKPAGSYDDAVALITSDQNADAALPLQPGGASIAMLTGQRSDTAVVLFHGLTVVPEQFRLIGEAYRAQGYNVWIPRLPQHGLADRMTDKLATVTTQDVRDFADHSIDIAAGLGTKVVVVGISGGGAVGLWAAAERPEVTGTVLISPLLRPVGYPAWQMRPIVRALRVLPNDIVAWNDDKVRDGDPETWGYPRQSYKAVGAFLSLTYWVEGRAAKSPITSRTVLVRNDADTTLDPAYSEDFMRRVVAPQQLTVVRIPASLGLGHDIVGFQRSNSSYPHLSEAYQYLSEALGIPLGDPKAAA